MVRVFPLGSGGQGRPLAGLERRLTRLLPLTVVLGLVASGLEALSIALFVRLTLVLLSPASASQSSSHLMAGVTRAANTVMPGDPVVGLSLIVLALVVCKSSFQIANAHFMSHVEGTAGREIRDMLAQKVLRLDFSFFLKNDTGRLVTIVDTQSWQATDAVRTIFNIAAGSAAIAMFTVLLVLSEWRLSLIVLAGVALSRLLQWLLSLRIAHLGRAAVESNHALGAQMMQVVRAIRIIRLFGQEPYEEHRFKTLSEDVRRTMLVAARWSSATMPAIEILLSALILAVLLSAGALAVPLATTAAFLVLLYRAQSPLMMVGHSLVHLASLRGSVEQVEWLLDQPEAPDTADRGAATFFDQAITFDHVDYAYPSHPGERVLSGLSFQIPPDSATAIVGRSGAGKSTVINLLCRLVAPSAGSIRLGAVDIARFDARHWREQIALAGQDVDMIAGSVRENIAYGFPDATDADIVEAAQGADAHDFIQQLPQGYDTHLGALGFGLSGGQRQRIGLARALVRRPEILILDEATSAVDGLSERTIIDLLQQHRRFGRAILISHRRSTLAMCDQGIVLDGGRVIESGPLRELSWFRSQGPTLAATEHERAAE